MDLKVQGSTHGERTLGSVIPLRAGPNRTVSLDQGQNLEGLPPPKRTILSSTSVGIRARDVTNINNPICSKKYI
jgi:hypothetical protein